MCVCVGGGRWGDRWRGYRLQFYWNVFISFLPFPEYEHGQHPHQVLYTQNSTRVHLPCSLTLVLEPAPPCQTVGPASPGESFFHLGWAAYCVTLCHLGAYDTCHLSASDLPRITATTPYSAITGSHAVLSVASFADEHFLKLRTSETAFLLFLPGRCSSSLSIFTINPLFSLHLQTPPDKCLTSYQLPYPPSTSSSHLQFLSSLLSLTIS